MLWNFGDALRDVLRLLQREPEEEPIYVEGLEPVTKPPRPSRSGP
jgi:hypothetical protein